jgi:hypothetical protein
MATERKYQCDCGLTSVAGYLVDELQRIAENRPEMCLLCRKAKELILTFHFGLKGGDPECMVLSAFSPTETAQWGDEKGRKITFLPFLVVVDCEGERSLWLPYWHLVEADGAVQRKYGQWAPFMSRQTFHDLLNQARRAGYLDDLRERY